MTVVAKRKPKKVVDERPAFQRAQIKHMIEEMLDRHARFVFLVPDTMLDEIPSMVFNTEVDEDRRDRSFNRARREIRIGDGLMWFDCERSGQRGVWLNAVSRRAEIIVSPYCHETTAAWVMGPGEA